MVKKYKRSDRVQLSKNFRLDEFKCKCTKGSVFALQTMLKMNYGNLIFDFKSRYQF